MLITAPRTLPSLWKSIRRAPACAAPPPPPSDLCVAAKCGRGTGRRLSLDKEDIEAGQGFSAEDVLLLGSLSAKWENADAIDTAVTAAVEGGAKVPPLLIL